MVATQPFDGFRPGVDAASAVAYLKARGYWAARFDQSGFPALFSEVDGTPALGKLITFLERLMNESDPTSTLLAERAQYFARSSGVSFAEALSQVSLPPGQWLKPENWPEDLGDKKRNRQMDLENSKRALEGGGLTQQMYDLAWKYANSGDITFKQAMARVGLEHQEWFTALAQKQREQGAGQWSPAAK